ncbi:MAG: murein biosynthesis integral membrane protein MurJ [Planctomycetota bacterium]|jgi:putative peptidoglycan lipid II flippase
MSFLRAASSMSALTLLSRILGLVRDVWTSHLLGTSWVNGVLQLAWMMPNMLRRLFGEGALSAAFVPVFARTVEQNGQSAARGLLASVFGAMLLGLGLVCLAVVWTTGWLPPETWHLSPAPDGDMAGPATPGEVGGLLNGLLAVLFPYALPVCLLAVLAGALNVFGVFAPAAAAPALLNVFGLAGLLHGWLASPDDLPGIATTVAWWLLVGGVAQLSLVVIPLRRRGCMPAPRLPRRGDGSGTVFRTMLPTILGMSLVQLNVFLDQGLAAWLLGTGSNYHIFLANRLLLFPHSLVALPLATAVFPRLATDASRDDLAAVRTQLDRAAGATLFLAVPATVGLALISDTLLDVAFVHGRYTAEDAVTTRWTTIALIAGLPALGASQLAARALYALGDPKTPARTSGVLVFVNLTLNLTFVLALGLGVAGLTAATSCCTYISAFVLRRAVARRAPGGVSAIGPVLRAVGASAVMAVVIVGIRAILPEMESRTGRTLVELLLPVVVGMAAYVAAQSAMRSPEIGLLREGIARRRARRSADS